MRLQVIVKGSMHARILSDGALVKLVLSEAEELGNSDGKPIRNAHHGERVR